jgi:nitroreductase
MADAPPVPETLDVFAAVARRHSVRSFRPDPVPVETLHEILTAAQQAPSGGNLQPWRVHVVSGDALVELKRRATSGEHRGETPGYDIYPASLWEPFRTRRFQCGEDLYASIDIQREDRRGRIAQFMRNAELFGAPVGLFFCIDRGLGPPQ